MSEIEQETEPQTASEEHRSSVADDIRAAMAEVEAKANEEPGAGGKVESANPEPKAAEPERQALDKKISSQSEGKAQEAVKGPSAEKPNLSSIAAPISWSEEKRQVFATLPKDVQQYIMERETESQRLISQKSDEYAKAVRKYSDFDRALEPYLPDLQQRGVNPVEAIQYLLKANEYLEKNPREAIARLAQMHGVKLSPEEIEEAQQSAAAYDPRIDLLRQELDQMRGFYSQFVQTQEQENLKRLNATVEQFERARDADGNPKYPHLENPEFEKVMADEVRKLKASGQDMPLTKLLETAYENAVWLSPALREAEIKKAQGIAEARRISEEKARAAEARKRSSSVFGSPSGASKPASTGSIRGDIEAAFDALGR